MAIAYYIRSFASSSASLWRTLDHESPDEAVNLGSLPSEFVTPGAIGLTEHYGDLYFLEWGSPTKLWRLESSNIESPNEAVNLGTLSLHAVTSHGGAATDDEGRIWIGGIYTIEPDRSRLYRINNPPDRSATGLGLLSSAYGGIGALAFLGDTLYFTSNETRRLYRYNPSGNLRPLATSGELQAMGSFGGKLYYFNDSFGYRIDDLTSSTVSGGRAYMGEFPASHLQGMVIVNNYSLYKGDSRRHGFYRGGDKRSLYKGDKKIL